MAPPTHQSHGADRVQKLAVERAPPHSYDCPHHLVSGASARRPAVRSQAAAAPSHRCRATTGAPPRECSCGERCAKSLFRCVLLGLYSPALSPAQSSPHVAAPAQHQASSLQRPRAGVRRPSRPQRRRSDLRAEPERSRSGFPVTAVGRRRARRPGFPSPAQRRGKERRSSGMRSRRTRTRWRAAATWWSPI